MITNTVLLLVLAICHSTTEAKKFYQHPMHYLNNTNDTSILRTLHMNDYMKCIEICAYWHKLRTDAYAAGPCLSIHVFDYIQDIKDRQSRYQCDLLSVDRTSITTRLVLAEDVDKKKRK